MEQKTALVIGATGLVGSTITQQLLEDETYSKVNILVRKPLDLEHPKLQQHRFDFDWPDADLVMGDHLFCALGTTIKRAGSQPAFRKVDYDYVVQTAKMAQYNGTTNMVYISSMGADPESSIFYMKVKGQVEQALGEVGFERCCILRPSMLLGERSEMRMGEMVGKLAMTAFSFAIPNKYKAIEVKQVAKAARHFIKQEASGKHVIESDELIKL